MIIRRPVRLSVAAAMLAHLGLRQEAAAIDAAVQDAVTTGNGTTDIGGSLGTRETGEYIASRVRRSEPGHEDMKHHERHETESRIT